ncbi:MAG TPA: hypothetical protein PLO37_01880 [Candidatus Hydrogenedentes bacterium]|nr:hypothetical protein [Candidatus Hydrogenedentota bacterium]HPG65566.1 hypothetical protein [Candidatus Hydrogenedentota bacterium]
MQAKSLEQAGPARRIAGSEKSWNLSELLVAWTSRRNVPKETKALFVLVPLVPSRWSNVISIVGNSQHAATVITYRKELGMHRAK